VLDRVYLVSGHYGGLDIRSHGEAPILEAISSSAGCFILGSHLGSFEVLRSLGARDSEFSIKVLMRPEQNKVINAFLDNLDTSVSEVVIPLGDPTSMLQVRDSIERGQIIGLLGDRAAADEKTQTCQFFGRDARFPTGPIQLALVLKAPIYLFYGIYRGGNRYDIHFELLTDPIPAPRAERDAITATLCERYASRLEHYAARWPNNWFNFYDFWR
jgi:predicted LPLAT superfamily acyltransferase